MSDPFAYTAPCLRRPSGRLRTWAGWVVLAILALTWAVFLRPRSLGGSVTYVLVSGESMEPTLHDGDLVIVRSRSSYEPGDIVAFRVNGRIVIHRIVGPAANNDGFSTRGDNTTGTDPWQPTIDQVLGAAWVRVPSAAGVVIFLRDPIHLAALAAGIAVFLILVGPNKASPRPGIGPRGVRWWP